MIRKYREYGTDATFATWCQIYNQISYATIIAIYIYICLCVYVCACIYKYISILKGRLKLNIFFLLHIFQEISSILYAITFYDMSLLTTRERHSQLKLELFTSSKPNYRQKSTTIIIFHKHICIYREWYSRKSVSNEAVFIPKRLCSYRLDRVGMCLSWCSVFIQCLSKANKLFIDSSNSRYGHHCRYVFILVLSNTNTASTSHIICTCCRFSGLSEISQDTIRKWYYNENISQGYL